ncbi:porin, partial [Herbaspirillum lusitanum]
MRGSRLLAAGAITIATAATLASSAQAQTSVTIYGRVVAGIDIQSNVHQANGNTGTQ